MSRVIPLTNTQIKNAKPTMKVGKNHGYKLSDGDGMQLKIASNGTKSFILNYRCPVTQKLTSMSFGVYPNISLSEARTMKREARALIAKGINPKKDKETKIKQAIEENQNTFKNVALKWFEVKKTEIAPSTAKKALRNLDLHLFPWIGDIPLSALTAQETIRILQPISAQGHLTVVQRLCQRINEVMSFGINTGIITYNPLIGIKKAFESPTPQNQKSITPDRLPELMSALQASNMRIQTRCLVEWQLHTMTRPAETAKAKWRDIDLDNKLWTVPAKDMKGTKAGEHRVPLTAQTLAILEVIRPISGHREFIFPSHKHPTRHANTEASNNAIKRTYIGSEQSGHGLRTLARTTLEEQGFDHFASEACLAHKVGSQVSQIYNRSTYMSQRIKIMKWWSEHIEQASIGNMGITGNKGLKIVNS